MNAINFVVRTRTGALETGTVGGKGQGFLIDAGSGNDISLNIRQSDLRGYDRAGDDLLITLADGRVIVLEGYFEAGADNRLFLSAESILNEVTFVESEGGALFAQYGPTESWGKWGPSDDLIFVEEPHVVAGTGYGEEEEVSMLATGLLGASGLGAAAGLGAAGLGAAALIGLGGDGDGDGAGSGGAGGGGEDPWVAPTVDDANAEIDISGNDDPRIVITGTGTEGSDVEVVIGQETVSGVVDEDGTWEVVFEGDDFPEDGVYEDIDVTVTDPDGTVTDLDGPSFEIDTTPPILEAASGTVSAGDLFNAEGYDAGVVIGGTSEAGAQVTVTIGEWSETVTVSDEGSWSVSIGSEVLAEGEYTSDVTITATDSFGNTTTITDSIEIDTVPHPLVIDPVGGDDLVNDADAEGGFEITGSSTAGAIVTVTFQSFTTDVLVAADGTWSVTVPEGDFEPGEYDATITATTVDLAGNGSSTTSTIRIDTVAEVTLTNAPITGDDIISEAEYNAGVTLAGTSQPGSSVEVTVEGVTQAATVSADGSWSVTFAAGALPQGTYTTTAMIVAVDGAGNSASTSYGFDVDTEADITIDTDSVEIDGVVNASERADGVVLNGTGEPGASVEVVAAGTVMNTTVGGNGVWTVTIPAAAVPEGETSLSVSATSTDAAGNRATAMGTIQIDTTTNVTVMTAGVEGDGVINAVEHTDGVILTGMAEPGATVAVTLGAVTHTVTASASGAWTAQYSAAELPTGEQTLNVTAVATDAAGNTATATGSVDVDTLVRNFALTSTPGGADQVINAEEAAQGLTLTGTTEPGGTVTLSLAGVTIPAVVDAAGNWTATFSAGQLPSGEQTVTLVANATDAAGNTDTLTQDVRIDTDAGILTISPAPVETDDVVNFVEASDGVVLTGTSNPNQMVSVTMNGVTHMVMTDAAGIWQAPFAANEIAQGTYTADITATITDSAGNTLTRTDSVRVDTVVDNFGVSGDAITADNVVNADERNDGVTLTGTTEPGSTVQVVIDGMSRSANVDASGNWSISLSSAELPTGETTVGVEIHTEDPAGNVAETSTVLTVDTEVTVLSISDAPVTADNVVNAIEAQSGFTLNGEVEPGSTVTVTFGGMALVATVAANGSWSVDIPPEAIPADAQGNMPISVEAVDAAGNVRTEASTISVDTEVPDALSWLGYGRNDEGVDQIRTEITANDVFIGQVTEGASPQVSAVELAGSADVPILNTAFHNFLNEVPDGTHLVVSTTDDAGNTSGAYLVTDDPATSNVTMTDALASALSEFQIETIDLHFAEDSHLTITESQILALSDTTDTVVVEGGSDDSVTITGAVATGTAMHNNESYNSFSLGDATVLIDDDITNVNTGVV